MNAPLTHLAETSPSGAPQDYQTVQRSMRECFLPRERELPVPTPSGRHVFFDGSVEERLAGIRGISPSESSFGQRVNGELERVDSYYQAVGAWVTFEHRAKLLANALEITPDAYRALMSASEMNSLVAFGKLLDQAQGSGFCADQVAKIVSEAGAINPKQIARQRMLMMRTVMNSTPVLVTDLLSQGSKGVYGFGAGKAQQIFAGKAKVGDMSFSAIASPRLFREPGVKDSGYVLRYCVGKVPFNGFEEDHPVYMLDPKIVESLTAWHASAYPNQPIQENPLISSMINLLLVPTHDWGHSWLLYDANAVTEAFKEWGDDIYEVEHRDKNKLIINYEIVVAATHKYTWQVLQDSDPSVLPAILQELRSYHEHVTDFAKFVRGQSGEERASKEEIYLMYVPLSTLPCVVDWNKSELQQLYSQYPVVAEQTVRILGNFFTIMASHDDGVPAKSAGGAFKSTAEYIREYPLRLELAERLRQERIRVLSITETGGVASEPFHAFRNLPPEVASQFSGAIPDPSVLPTLSFALEKLQSSMSNVGYDQAAIARVLDRVKVAPSGHIFFKLGRQELDIDRFPVCEQDKRVLLVSIPEGVQVPLRTRTSVSLMGEVTKQHTVATSSDMLAFNVENKQRAEEILAAGDGLTGAEFFSAIIRKGNELVNVESAEGANDIYPIRKEVARRLYGTDTTGFRELLGRKRFASATGGPVELDLHDGSTQRTLNGVFVYIPGAESGAVGNMDRDPDLHGIEARVFNRTYSASADSIQPFSLRAESELTGALNPTLLARALHEFMETLSEINLQIDLGSGNRELGRGLFT
jgi:hypothetical protein